MANWSAWHQNPFKALKEATDARDDAQSYARALVELRKVADWDDFEAEHLMDDLLQEIGGATNYVIQYGSDENHGKYRAIYDYGAQPEPAPDLAAEALALARDLGEMLDNFMSHPSEPTRDEKAKAMRYSRQIARLEKRHAATE